MVTVMSTAPAMWAGAVTVTRVPVEFTVNVVADVVPNLTAVTPPRFTPVIFTAVPPRWVPVVGASEVTEGAT